MQKKHYPYMKKAFKYIISSFLIWKILSVVVAVVAVYNIPIYSQSFFGGKYINYVTNPLLWTWANFDGEHYLSIAQNGYKNLQQAFFPLYPFIVKLFSFGGNEFNLKPFLISGILVSNISFLVSLFILREVVLMDYSKKVADYSMLLLLVFPTSFFFGSVYTESLFLLLSLLTYYFYRKEKYLLATVFGFLTTLTRLYGLFVILMVAVDVLVKKTKFVDILKKKIYLISFSVFGAISYMYYCFIKWGDAFAFFNLQTLSGEQRSTDLIMLPQVFYRYIFKIIPNLDFSYFPYTFTTLLELVTAILFLLITIFTFKKIRWDYWVYIVVCYLVPTLTGSFSSLPRYVLVIFPAFIVSSKFLENKNKYIKLGILVTLAIISVIAESLFVRGYFVS